MLPWPLRHLLIRVRIVYQIYLSIRSQRLKRWQPLLKAHLVLTIAVFSLHVSGI